MKYILIFLIELYQKTLSPDHGVFKVFYPHGFCRFHPTCSSYAKEAIGRHGAIAGSFLAIARVSRCHPYGATGHDPVPNSEVN